MVAKLRDLWFAQPFQRGSVDNCESGNGFATEEEATNYAEEWAGAIPYNDCEHEIVVFKAIASYRGRISPEKHNVRKAPANEGEK